MVNEKLYVFKTVLKRNKGLMRLIEIKGSQTLCDFDGILRKAFNHDTEDHLSAFCNGCVWQSESLGDIDPDGNGKNANKPVEELGLQKGDKIEYVYDFGDDIQHLITLENITEPAEDVKYPRIASYNQSKLNNSEKIEKGTITTLDMYCTFK
jgi:hypothetical protein